MAARSSAAASQLPAIGVTLPAKLGIGIVRYSSTELLQITVPSMGVKPELKAMLGRVRLLRTAVWRNRSYQLRGKRKRCARRQKRGKQAGLLARLKASNRPALPTLFLANVCSLDNKMDLMRLRLRSFTEMRNCCAMLLTETWLNNRMPDSAY